MARKPFRGTVAANVQLHGTGAINVDACRIGTEEAGWKGSAGGQGDVYAGRWGNGEPRPTAGRWPANVVLDEVAAELLDQQSGERKSGGRTVHDGEVEQSNWRRNEGRIDPKIKSAFHIDSSTGGASRFFYVAKASRAERNAGLNDLDAEPLNWSSGEQNPGSFQSDNTNRTSPNNHPTVKPLALVRWLITLVTPPGGIVFDPFGGSFTTLVAAAQLGFPAIGIDQEERYCRIGARRVDHALNQPRALTLEGIA